MEDDGKTYVYLVGTGPKDHCRLEDYASQAWKALNPALKKDRNRWRRAERHGAIPIHGCLAVIGRAEAV